MLTDRQEEGLVLSYLQVKYGCIVNTESLKHSTAIYECELIAKDGTRYLPQVKSGASGNAQFPVKDYYEKIKKISEQIGYKAVAVVFYENEDYGDFEETNLIKITKEELMQFIDLNRLFVSKSVLESYDLIKK